MALELEVAVALNTTVIKSGKANRGDTYWQLVKVVDEYFMIYTTYGTQSETTVQKFSITRNTSYGSYLVCSADALCLYKALVQAIKATNSGLLSLCKSIAQETPNSSIDDDNLLVSEMSNISTIEYSFKKIKAHSLSLKQRLDMYKDCKSYLDSAIEAVESEYEEQEERLAREAFSE